MSKPYRPWVAAAAAAALLASLSAPPVSAETVVVGDQVLVRQTEVPHPKRGMSMAQVQKNFGEPRERHPTIGTPPITRWDYENFAVFFEKDLVIDAVVPGASAPSSPSSPSDPSSTPAGAPDAAPIPATAPAAAAPAVQTAGAQPSAVAPATAPVPAAAGTPDAQKAGSTSKTDDPLSDVSLHH